MITEEHFKALRQRREAAADLRLACIAADEAGSLLHIAYDPGITQRVSTKDAALVRRLRAVQ
jgi:hypothetical protein